MEMTNSNGMDRFVGSIIHFKIENYGRGSIYIKSIQRYPDATCKVYCKAVFNSGHEVNYSFDGLINNLQFTFDFSNTALTTLKLKLTETDLIKSLPKIQNKPLDFLK